MVTGTDLPPLENPPIEHELGASSRINPETLLASAMPDWSSLKTDSGAAGRSSPAEAESSESPNLLWIAPSNVAKTRPFEHRKIYCGFSGTCGFSGAFQGRDGIYPKCKKIETVMIAIS